MGDDRLRWNFGQLHYRIYISKARRRAPFVAFYSVAIRRVQSCDPEIYGLGAQIRERKGSTIDIY